MFAVLLVGGRNALNEASRFVLTADIVGEKLGWLAATLHDLTDEYGMRHCSTPTSSNMITGCKWMSVDANWFNPDQAVALMSGDPIYEELRRDAYSNSHFRH
ncbi:hypothetical protein [Methylobacterium symbioticum]